MSNYQAIATVTAVIRQILAEYSTDVKGIKITTSPPDVFGRRRSDNRLNLFLYHVTLNNGYKDWDIPSRNAKGELIRKPLLALNLHYLLTAYANDDDELQAHKILANAMRVLHENPILTRDMIRDTILAESKIAESNLADQVELVKINFHPLSLEEISKLWSSFFQTNYRISVAYQATVVLLEGKTKPKPTLPVKDRLLYVLPFRQPVIERVEPQIYKWIPGAKLTIKGRNLKGQEVTVQFGKISATPKSEDINNNQILIAIPTTLTAGIKPVQVVHKLEMGSPSTPHEIYRSNLVAFVLPPKMTQSDLDPYSLSYGDNLTINFEPKIKPEQEVSLLIGSRTYNITQHKTGTTPVDKLSFKISNKKDEEDTQGILVLPTGTFLVRLRVDGAESTLELETDKNKSTYGQFIEPKITVS